MTSFEDSRSVRLRKSNRSAFIQVSRRSRVPLEFPLSSRRLMCKMLYSVRCNLGLGRCRRLQIMIIPSVRASRFGHPSLLVVFTTFSASFTSPLQAASHSSAFISTPLTTSANASQVHMKSPFSTPSVEPF